VQEKEDVLEAVLLTVRKSEKRGFFARLGTASPRVRAALAAVAVSLAAIPVCFFLFKGAPVEDEFRAKGHRDDIPFFSVSCVDGVKKIPCRTGAKLAFKLNQKPDKLYFAAFAKRDSDGLIYWYFPKDASSKSISLKDLGKDVVLSLGIQLDDTYKPGRYEVFGFLSKAPLDRQAIRESTEGDLGDEQDSVVFSIVNFHVEQ
jgi:hypothetical protein